MNVIVNNSSVHMFHFFKECSDLLKFNQNWTSSENFRLLSGDICRSPYLNPPKSRSYAPFGAMPQLNQPNNNRRIEPSWLFLCLTFFSIIHYTKMYFIIRKRRSLTTSILSWLGQVPILPDIAILYKWSTLYSLSN